jgi:hypothetical protein
MRIKFEPRDWWIGLYWKTESHWDYVANGTQFTRTYYLCLLPTLPIVWERRWCVLVYNEH